MMINSIKGNQANGNQQNIIGSYNQVTIITANGALPDENLTSLFLKEIITPLSQKGEYENAIQLINTQLKKINFEKKALIFVKADLLLRSNKLKEADELLKSINEYEKDSKILGKLSIIAINMDDRSKALNYADKAIQLEKENGKAYFAKVAFYEGDDIEYYIKTLPKKVQKSNELDIQLAWYYYNKNQFQNSAKYFRDAMNKNSDNKSLCVYYANPLIELALNNQINEQNQKMFIEAKNILEDFLSTVQLNQWTKEWYLSLALLEQYTGDTDSSLIIFDEILKFDPQFIRANYHQAMLFLTLNRIDEAKSLFEKCLSSNNIPGILKINSAGILSEIYLRNEDNNNALKLLDKFLNSGLQPKFRKGFINLKIEALIAVGDNEQFDTFIKEIENEYEDELFFWTGRLKHAIKNMNQNSIKKLIYNSLALAKETRFHFNDRHNYAMECIYAKYFNEAEEVFDTFINEIVKETEYEYIVKNYLRLIMNEQKKGSKAFLFLKNSIKNYPDSRYLNEAFGMLYEKIGNNDEALKHYKKYTKKHPDDLDMIMRGGRIAFQKNDIKFLNAYIFKNGIKEKIIKGEYNQYTTGIYFDILFLSGKINEALFFAYEMRRKEFYNQYWHQALFRIFLLNPEFKLEIEKYLSYTSVGVDTAVEVQVDQKKEKYTYYIEKGRINPTKEEISTDSDIYKLLEGAKEGEIRTKNANFKPKEYKVLKVMHKYIYAFQDSLSNARDYFPDEEGLPMAFDIGKPENGEEYSPEQKEKIISIFEKIGKGAKDSDETFFKTYDEYVLEKKAMPLHVFSKFRNIFSSYKLLTSKKHRILVDVGNPIDINNAIKMLDERPQFAIDWFTICTLVQLSDTVIQTIVKTFGKFIFSVYHESYIKEQNQGIVINELIPKVDEFVKSYCESKPITEILENQKKDIAEIEEYFLESEKATYRIAQRPGVLLFSDDYASRRFFRDKYKNSNSVWTNAILMYFHQKHLLSEEEYMKAVKTLFDLNYWWTYPEIYVLLSFLAQDSRSSKSEMSHSTKNIISEYAHTDKPLIILGALFKNSKIHFFNCNILINAIQYFFKEIPETNFPTVNSLKFLKQQINTLSPEYNHVLRKIVDEQIKKLEK